MTEETNPNVTDVVAEEVVEPANDEVVGDVPVVDGETPDGPTLGIVDVRNAVNIIDYACSQGAFKGWETITQVMAVRNNLNSFVAAVSPPVEEGAEGEGTESGDAEGKGGSDEAPVTEAPHEKPAAELAPAPTA